MKKLRLAVLFGGCSPEHEVSLQSAHGVLTHLDPAKYEPVPVGITRQGRWFLYRGPYDALPDGSWERQSAFLSPAGPSALRLDAAFPVLHGKNGEDGTVQGLLALADIPVVGCGVLPSALCMDKDMAHRLAAGLGVAVPRSALFWAGEDLALLGPRTAGLSYPLFVKPARAGSSFGVSRIAGPAELEGAVAAALEHDSKVVMEEAVPGFEVGCAVLGREELTVGLVDEIQLAGGFFDYTEKYHLITSAIHVPARISPEKTAEVRETAKTVYRALGCDGFARVDLFLTPEGKVVFNEVNTIPGFTPHSRYPAMMAGIGLDFPALLDRLIGLAVSP